METNILKNVKKVLNLDPDDTTFDQDLIIFVNASFSKLTDVGIGPMTGFRIESGNEEWLDFLQKDDPLYEDSKAFICLNTRLLFDPPTSSYQITAIKDQAEEILWRLEVRRQKVPHEWEKEDTEWLKNSWTLF